MPVGHVVTFGFKANTQPEAILALGAALDELASETSALSYHHGADLNIRQGNADYSVTATFEDEDAFSASITSRVTCKSCANFLRRISNPVRPFNSRSRPDVSRVAWCVRSLKCRSTARHARTRNHRFSSREEATHRWPGEPYRTS